MKQLGAHTHTQMQVKERGFPGGSVVKNPPAKQETQVRSLGQEDSLEKEMATHSSLLAWKMPWTEEPGRSQSMGIAKTRLAIQQQQIKDREIIKLLNLCLIPQNCYLPSTLLGVKEWDLFSFGHCAAVHAVTKSRKQLGDWTVTTAKMLEMLILSDNSLTLLTPEVPQFTSLCSHSSRQDHEFAMEAVQITDSFQRTGKNPASNKPHLSSRCIFSLPYRHLSLCTSHLSKESKWN